MGSSSTDSRRSGNCEGRNLSGEKRRREAISMAPILTFSNGGMKFSSDPDTNGKFDVYRCIMAINFRRPKGFGGQTVHVQIPSTLDGASPKIYVAMAVSGISDGVKAGPDGGLRSPPSWWSGLSLQLAPFQSPLPSVLFAFFLLNDRIL
ncbi:slufate transporter 2 [Striga asiatica]|uniref:Slufate transporter 2 n=1 Tax=Striga asiatica TaxID=4170 RepID=A0A5A7P5C0_STRAF|nr:slufate transporter 2 [Striga asiatica]